MSRFLALLVLAVSLVAAEPLALPAEGVGFAGSLTGTIDLNAKGGGLFIVVTAATPDATSKASDATKLVGAKVQVMPAYDTKVEDKWTPNPEQLKAIEGLKKGATVTVTVKPTKKGYLAMTAPPQAQ
jgi:hypothetical protein